MVLAAGALPDLVLLPSIAAAHGTGGCFVGSAVGTAASVLLLSIRLLRRGIAQRKARRREGAGDRFSAWSPARIPRPGRS